MIQRRVQMNKVLVKLPSQLSPRMCHPRARRDKEPHLVDNALENVEIPSDKQDASPGQNQLTPATKTTTRRIDVPNNKVGVLIGKAGDTIKYLQYNYGAKIHITRDAYADPQDMMTITAVHLFSNLIRLPSRIPWPSISHPVAFLSRIRLLFLTTSSFSLLFFFSTALLSPWISGGVALFVLDSRVHTFIVVLLCLASVLCQFLSIFYWFL
ncbi:hypothetical protein HN51_000536 [Arachis hypogaea]